jgi:hypothetical protein
MAWRQWLRRGQHGLQWITMANETHYSIADLDPVAPFEYFRVFREKPDFVPEERLMFAVLNDAIECLTKYRNAKSRSHKALYRDARNWILSKDNGSVFSFENICETLKIDPGRFRVGLRHWLEDTPAKIPPVKVWRQPVRYRSRVRKFRFRA